MEAQDSEKPKHPERKEQNWRYHTPWWQTILKSHSKQYSMALAEKQIHLPVEENKPTHIWTTDLWQRNKAHTMEEEWLQQMVLGKLDSKMQKKNQNKTKPKLDCYLTLYTKINSNWINVLK